jgi:hypothetical protein
LRGKVATKHHSRSWRRDPTGQDDREEASIDLPALIDADKSFVGTPTWVFREGINRRLELSMPLDVGGVTVEGLFFDGHCLADAPNADVTFVLTFTRSDEVDPGFGTSGII